MKIVVIGSVAAGTSAAAKARRNMEDAEIIIYEKDKDISYSGCGLPYFIGKKVDTIEKLIPRNAAFFKKKYNIDIKTRHEVLQIDSKNKKLKIINLQTKDIFEDTYDKLVISTGATPFIPKIIDIDKKNVFPLRNPTNAVDIHNFIEEYNPTKATIVGAGFIGLEVAENLKEIGIDVTIVELANQVMPPLDKDMAVYIERHLKEKGIKLLLGDAVTEIRGDTLGRKVILKSGDTIDTELIIMSVGIRPNVNLAVKSGVELGETRAIKVNNKMQTNIDSIYSCGDCAESYSLITKKSIYVPLGSTANKMGRIAGDSLTGGSLEFRGILGTGIFKVFDLSVAMTGLTEKQAIKDGFEIEVCHNIKPDKPAYMGGKQMTIKAIADKNTGKLLGAQIIGPQGIDKRIDIFVTAITYGAKVEDLFHLDLAYAPPFSITKDPVMYTGMILDNAINKGRKLITPEKLDIIINSNEDVQIIDARIEDQYIKNNVTQSINIPHAEMRCACQKLDKDKTTVTYCNKGVTGNAAQNILLNKGFKKVYNLSGGNTNYQIQKKKKTD
ncbi:FAD-dependent oxidoreductase [Clostridium sp. DL1XJH146]